MDKGRRRRTLPMAPASPTKGSRPAGINLDKRQSEVLFEIDVDSATNAASPTAIASPLVGVVSPATPRLDSLLSSRQGSRSSPTRQTSTSNSPLRDADEMMENQNVVVAVRLRPSSEREVAAGGESIIEMQGNETFIHGPVKEHSFQYDHSFNSYDRSSPRFASQRVIFDKLGRPLLNRAMEGYNCCLFAYGQTGSGKSYSMMGEQKERGVIPRFSETMWELIRKQPDTNFKVEVSYFEIYAEQIYDLLVPPTHGVEKSRLKVREHPIMGPYVDNLTVYPALNFEDIEGYINLGGKYRATASTNMNATSSRSHAVFTITITQVEKEEGEEHTKVSKVNLIDLAGSERSDRAGTSGQRLREGSAINKSLHTLGKIISTLAANGMAGARKRKAFVPYRDSVLTWILKESLGGNAKTAMLATLSPCHENYQETLSTLRYAQQARSIVNEAKINEDENIALIRELRLEIEKLRNQYGHAKGNVAMAEVESLREKLASSERLMADINRSWEEKLRQSEKIREENQKRMEAQGVDQNMQKIDNRQPNLVNLNEDPQLSEMLIYIIKPGDTTIGKDSGNDVSLKGVFVRGNHARLHSSDEGLSLTAIEDALMYVNGEMVPHSGTVQLKHGDRIIIGNHHFFRLNIPKSNEGSSSAATPFDGEIKDYQFAREELERVQTARIEKQLQQEHDKQKQQILQQLENAEQSALQKLEIQRKEFEGKLKMLEREQSQLAGERNSMVEQAVVTAQAEERERAMAEIARQREELERERDLMEERMQEEKKAERRQREEDLAAKNKIIDELELEKSKIKKDLESLKKKSDERRLSQNAQALLGARFGKPHENKKHDWIHISARIDEANELSNRMQQNTVFSRADDCMDGGDAVIQLHNTKLGITTTWTLAKFQERMLQIADAYRQIESGSDPKCADSLFYDQDDEWEKDTVDAANIRWLRAHPRSRSLYELPSNAKMQFQGTLETIKAEAKAKREASGGRSTIDKLTGGASPRKKVLSVSYDEIPSVPLLCRQYVKNALGSLMEQNSKARSSADDIVEAASALHRAVNVLWEDFNNADVTNQIPLKEQSNIRNASLSAAISTELMCTTIRAVAHGPDGKFVGHICESLSSAASSTATSMGKLLQGIENGIESMVADSRDEVIKGISALSMAAGELAIATSKNDDDEEEVREDDDIDDPAEFAFDEEEASYASTSRMVTISPRKGEAPPSESPFKIDDEILEAFDRGARMHVDKSLSNLTQDMDECSSSISNLIRHLNAASNVSAGVVQAASSVIKSTRETFVTAQSLQAALLESADTNARAKMTFYRKSFSRAKGIINEVREVADAINGLVSGCKRAVEGSDGVEQVMSHAKTLRAAIARLTSSADTKLVGSNTTTEHRGLSAKLKNACNDVTRASKHLTSECEEYSSSDVARKKRASQTAPSTPTRIGSIKRSSMVRSSMKAPAGPMSEVKRRALLVEHESEVFRLEAELRDAQAKVKELRKKAYGGFAPPMAELDGATKA